MIIKRIGVLIFASVLCAMSTSQNMHAGHEPTSENIKDLFEWMQITQHPAPKADWRDCLKRLRAENVGDEIVVYNCATWSHQGLTSTLIALQSENDWIPILETHLDETKNTSKTVLHLVGGTGMMPLYTAAVPPPELQEALRGSAMTLPKSLTDTPYMELLRSGMTIASVGYWGTSFRTLNERGEIALASQDVRTAFDYYFGSTGEEPVLVTESLGNHWTCNGFVPVTDLIMPPWLRMRAD